MPKDEENLYRYFAGFDMSYDEFRVLCRESWKDEDFIIVFIDSSTKTTEI